MLMIKLYVFFWSLLRIFAFIITNVREYGMSITIIEMRNSSLVNHSHFLFFLQSIGILQLISNTPPWKLVHFICTYIVVDVITIMVIIIVFDHCQFLSSIPHIPAITAQYRIIDALIVKWWEIVVVVERCIVCSWNVAYFDEWFITVFILLISLVYQLRKSDQPKRVVVTLSSYHRSTILTCHHWYFTITLLLNFGCLPHGRTCL